MKAVNGIDPRGGHNLKTKRNAAVLAYYRAGHTMQETAKKYGITRQRVGQLVRGERSAAETIKMRRERLEKALRDPNGYRRFVAT